MKQIQLKKFYYHFRHRVLTTNNLVVLVALFIAVNWAWGSVNVLQRNYALERDLDAKKRQLTLVQLEADTLRYQQRYYKSDEYKELAVRRQLGLVFPGEKVLILPPNSAAAKQSDENSSKNRVFITKPTNMEQWTNFLFGGNSAGGL